VSSKVKRKAIVEAHLMWAVPDGEGQQHEVAGESISITFISS
jgi:hypothetical protein